MKFGKLFFVLVLIIFIYSLSVFADCDRYYFGTDYMTTRNGQDACYSPIDTCNGIPSEFDEKLIITCPNSAEVDTDFNIQIQSQEGYFDEIGYIIGLNSINFNDFTSSLYEFEDLSISAPGNYDIFIPKSSLKVIQ